MADTRARAVDLWRESRASRRMHEWLHGACKKASSSTCLCVVDRAGDIDACKKGDVTTGVQLLSLDVAVAWIQAG
jgi:phosphosulfolactate phosphohydrolase-like enzyme